MTHRSCSLEAFEQIDYEATEMKRYSSSNCVVLTGTPPNQHYSEVLFLLQGEDLGISGDDDDQTVFTRAEPIFQVLVKTHNRAFERASNLGDARARAEIRKALGV